MKIALGHVRGGGEMGRLWHKLGRLENKKTSSSDCLTVMQYLINKGNEIDKREYLFVSV